MNRRRLLISALAGIGLAGGLAGVGAGLRWHVTPRRWPSLTDAHLESLLAMPDWPARVLFVGNSFTVRHDVPGLVARRAAEAGQPLQVAMAAANGARLVETWRIGAFRTVLQAGWDVVVLQDFSTMVLRAHDRWGAAHAMRAIAAMSGARRVLLYPTWALPADHPVYRGGGGWRAVTPDTRDDFAERITEFYAPLAAREGWRRAPVTEALHADISLYSEGDGHHLNAAGASLVADVLWESMRGWL